MIIEAHLCLSAGETSAATAAPAPMRQPVSLCAPAHRLPTVSAAAAAAPQPAPAAQRNGAMAVPRPASSIARSRESRPRVSPVLQPHLHKLRCTRLSALLGERALFAEPLPSGMLSSGCLQYCQHAGKRNRMEAHIAGKSVSCILES